MPLWDFEIPVPFRLETGQEVRGSLKRRRSLVSGHVNDVSTFGIQSEIAQFYLDCIFIVLLRSVS